VFIQSIQFYQISTCNSITYMIGAHQKGRDLINLMQLLLVLEM